MSSICMESVAMNIPCIVYDESKGLEYMPIPNDIENSIWKLCKNSKQIENAINFFFDQNREEFKINYNISKRIKKNYFLEVNKNNVLEFLGYNT